MSGERRFGGACLNVDQLISTCRRRWYPASARYQATARIGIHRDYRSATEQSAKVDPVSDALTDRGNQSCGCCLPIDPKLLIVQCRLFGDDPVAEPRGAAGSSNISIIDVAVWRRVSCWSHAAARWPVVASARRRAALILGAASIARLPPTNHRRRPPCGDRPLPHPAPHRRLAQVAHPAGRSRMLIAVHGAARPPAAAATSASSFHEKEFREKELATAASRRRQRVGRIAGRSADQRRSVGAPLARARVQCECG